MAEAHSPVRWKLSRNQLGSWWAVRIAVHPRCRVMKQITVEFIETHPECLNVQRPLDLLPVLLENEDLASLKEVLLITVLIEREYEVLKGVLYRMEKR